MAEELFNNQVGPVEELIDDKKVDDVNVDIDPTKKDKKKESRFNKPFNFNKEIPEFAISVEQKEKKKNLEELRIVDPRHVDSRASNNFQLDKMFNDDEFLESVIGTDYNNWNYLLREQDGGQGEKVGMGRNNYQKLLRAAKDIYYDKDGQLDAVYNVTEAEFEIMFQNKVTNLANKQKTDNVAKAVKRADEEVDSDILKIYKRKFIAEGAIVHDMPMQVADDGIKITNDLRELNKKISDLKANNEEVPASMTASLERLTSAHANFISQFGKNTKVFLNWDGTPIAGDDIKNENGVEVDFENDEIDLKSLFAAIIEKEKGLLEKPLTEGEVIKRALEDNLQSQVVWDRDSKIIYDVTVNDSNAQNFIKNKLGIKPHGSNSRGLQYKISKGDLSRYYTDIVASTGESGFGAPDGYFALTESAKKFDYKPGIFEGDDKEFTGGPSGSDPDKAFKRSLKDHEELRYSLLKEQSLLWRMDLFNVDPSSSNSYALDKKGTGDYFKTMSNIVWNEVYGKKGQINSDLKSIMKSTNRETDLMLEDYMYSKGLTLTPTMLDNLKTSTVYELSERATGFLPTIVKFAITDVLIRKTGIITGPLAMINYARNFQKGKSGVLASEMYIKDAVKLSGHARGTEGFAAFMATKGYKVVKPGAFNMTMEAGLKVIVEEAKMKFVFGDDYHMAGGAAFLGVGKLFSKVFPNTLANSPAMLRFLGLNRSGGAGMLSTQMAVNLEAFVDDLRGNETYTNVIKENYKDLGETGWSAFMDYLVFSTFGVRGVVGKYNSKSKAGERGFMGLRGLTNIKSLNGKSKELALDYRKKIREEKDPDKKAEYEKEFRKYSDLYAQTSAQLRIFAENSPASVKDASNHTNEVFNEKLSEKDKIKLEFTKEKDSSFTDKEGENKIVINTERGIGQTVHEYGHVGVKISGGDPKVLNDLYRTVQGAFPRLEASIVEAYGTPNKNGVKEMNRDLKVEEFMMHVAQKLTRPGEYAYHVAKGTFGQVAQSFNRWYTAQYGKRYAAFSELDLTTEKGVLEFFGNYAQVVKNKTITTKYIDFMTKELTNPKYLNKVNRRLTLEDWASLTKDKKVGEEITSSEKFSKEVRGKIETEFMQLYKGRINIFSNPESEKYEPDVTKRQELQLEAINKHFLSPKMRGGQRTPAPAEALAYWIARKARAKGYEMSDKELDIFASYVMKGSGKEGNKDRTITGIIENYIKYNTKDGGAKQDISTTLIQQLILRIPEIHEAAFGKKNIKTVEFDPNKNVETVEQREFDVIDPSKRMYEGNVELAPVFDVNIEVAAGEYVKKASYKDLSSANRINENVSSDLVSKLQDKAYMSESSQKQLRKTIEEKVLAENKLAKTPFDITTDKGLIKFEKLVNKEFKKELKESKYNYIFSKANMIYKALPNNIDLVTGESNFVMKTFGKFYTNTGQRLKTVDIFNDNTQSKKGEGPYGQVKKKFSSEMEQKIAIMDAIFKPEAGGKPLTNAQINTRINSALKYVAYTIKNQAVRKALNNTDVRRVMEESNFPLINSIKIAQELTNIRKNARQTLGDKTLFSKLLNENNIEELGKVKMTENRPQWEENFTSKVYELVDPAILKDLAKANYPIEKFVEMVGNNLYGSKKITILDQIPVEKRKDTDTKMISGKWVEAGNQWGYKDAKNLVTNTLGAQFRSKMRKSESYQEMIYDAHSVIAGFLPEVLTNTLMHNKFMGSGSTVWETGIFQPKGVNSAGKPAWRTMSSDALKLWVKKSNIVPTTKKTKEMLLELDFINKSMKPNEIKEAVSKVKRAFEIYTVTDNGKAKAYNLELLEQAVREGKDLNDADVRLEIKEKFNKKWKLSEEVMKANDTILELYMRAGKKYYNNSKNKTVALNNLMFIFGEQTSIGGGPLRGLATHRSISFDLEGMRKGSQSEHALPVSGLSTNSLGRIINLEGPAFTKAIRELIEIYKQDIIPREAQQNNDYKIVDGKKVRTSQDFDAAIERAGSESTWIEDFRQARNQVGLFSKFSSYGERIATNKTIGNLVETLSTGAGLSKKYSKNLDKVDLVNKLIKIEKVRLGMFDKKKGGTFLDFDDTLVFTKSLIKYTKPDGTKGSLNAEQYAKSYESLTELGYKWDFSEFNEVKNPSLAPLFNKALKLQSKFGPEHMYIVTARPAQAAPAIHGYLKSKGLNIPLKNITGLGNSTSEAKGLWVAEKIGEGYNDIYFADDALQNVQAVKNVVDQFDVKSKVQLARKKMSLELSDQFNFIIEETSGVKAESVFSRGRGKVEGQKRGKFNFFMSPSAEDFGGLLYKFAGKGKLGEAHLEWMQDKLITPFVKATRDMDTYRQSTTNDYNSLKKQHPKVVKLLKKKVPGSVYTYDNAIRVHRWTKAGYEVPEISKAEHKLLFEFVANNPELLEFSEKLGLITKRVEGYSEPTVDWLADNIVGDLANLTTGINRAAMLNEWVQNRQAIFGEWKFEGGKAILSGDNMNKIEAIHGGKFREALEDITYRMEFGSGMNSGSSRIVNNWNKWVNGSVGSIMFLNARSAALQTLSTVNYLNWHDNNPLKAAGALANFPQFIKDFTYIFNSDMLKQRRSGLKLDINEAALANAVSGKSNKVKATVAYLLKKGFLPTQIADSFAIASGGATMYRNRIKTYLKEGFTEKEAQEKAWIDFSKVTETTQQSSSPYLISQQQATPLGKTVLSFNNTPMQYNRIMKKAFLDIANKRGDIKTHISKIVYYGGVQNVIFHSLQSALFALTMDSEGDLEGKEEEKSMRVLNGMVDTILRGTGLTGAVISTAKNAILEYYKQEQKGWQADHTYTVLQTLKLSPSIGSKASGIYSATQGMKFNAGAVDGMSPWAYNNPSLLAKTQVFESVTNVPLARVVKKTNNLAQAFNSENQKWQRIMLGAGWSTWDLGVKDREVQDLNEMFKKYKKNKSKRKSKSL